MKKIQTKLVLTLLVITMLPVFPVYYLVKNLMQQSLEIGYNEKVESALEAASGVARELRRKYQEETLSRVSEMSAQPWVIQVFRAGMIPEKSFTDETEQVRIGFYDTDGKLINIYKNGSGFEELIFNQNDILQFLETQSPQMLQTGRPEFTLASAPVFLNRQHAGIIILTRKTPERISNMFSEIVNVNQMFKTLDFFEGDLRQGFIMTFFAVYVPISLLSIGIGITFARRITSPLVGLSKAAGVVARGNWDYRVPETSRDEIGELAVAFNRMVATLKEKQDQVVNLEKMAAWREIARVLAHEIKNPLTPIQLTVQQMKDQYSGDDAEYQNLLEECYEIITDEIESLRSLVREFSEFARMPKLQFEPGNLNELLEDLGRLYPKERIKIVRNPSLPEFEFDAEKLRRVLINLLDNGLDSISEKGSGSIQLDVHEENGWIHLHYADSGNGIPDDLQEKIFEPYFSTKKSGMGLGLAIVKRIITEHGGTIDVESEEGNGTRFVIRLPMKRPRDDSQAV